VPKTYNAYEKLTNKNHPKQMNRTINRPDVGSRFAWDLEWKTKKHLTSRRELFSRQNAKCAKIFSRSSATCRY